MACKQCGKPLVFSASLFCHRTCKDEYYAAKVQDAIQPPEGVRLVEGDYSGVEVALAAAAMVECAGLLPCVICGDKVANALLVDGELICHSCSKIPVECESCGSELKEYYPDSVNSTCEICEKTVVGYWVGHAHESDEMRATASMIAEVGNLILERLKEKA